ncbi:hypothetical protein DR64_7606 [Paraburkholderia xenovorans LB400]|uniref:Insertion element IS402-like domain-containing protein n=1 Tax=Paraburkholderia xenovorans (strain LB400) TaxID=266265 RepID=Q13GS1_PARXL|nr:hypothetical protein Bxe_C0837 [Paraburkholderia xenovorans LB400]AIP34003.1 hypothetical protein DR64_7606 [Paraburkholderia xenovorans LB400]
MPERKPYPTDVSDEEWSFAAPYLALMSEDAPQRRYELREMFNALRWMARAGASWRMLPTNFPPWELVYQQTQRWLNAGCFEAMVAVCERSCADSFIVRVRVTAFTITGDGQMPSSLILGCSRCPRLIGWRANPYMETTDWRARRWKTAHRVRREGTAIAVSYP